MFTSWIRSVMQSVNCTSYDVLCHCDQLDSVVMIDPFYIYCNIELGAL
jgi:hypothetical protein